MSPVVEGNLLVDKIFSVRRSGGVREKLTLCENLALLSSGNTILDFDAIQPHQYHYFYSFLVNLSAIVLNHTGGSGDRSDPEFWGECLREIAGDTDTPFCLYVEDVTLPAFFQPPLEIGELEQMKKNKKGEETTTPVWKTGFTPGEIDILVSGGNHDVKYQQIVSPSPEHWAYALISLQTGEGFSGQKNYGISRMNGGTSSRPCVAIVSGLGVGDRFRRDVQLLLDSRDQLVDRFGYKGSDGISLMWREPWDGDARISPTECDPFYIEYCRRIRLVKDGGALVVRTANSTDFRMEDSTGDTGDLWTPVGLVTRKSLTIPEEGFSYRKVSEILWGGKFEWSPAMCMDALPSGVDLYFYASALVRGNGKTAGYHQRIIPIPKAARGYIKRKTTAHIVEDRVKVVATVHDDILRLALRALFQGGPAIDKIKKKDRRPTDLLRDMVQRVDDIFFQSLWSQLHLDPEERSVVWQDEVVKIAEDVLNGACDRSIAPVARRYKAISRVKSIFWGMVNKKFPDLHQWRKTKEEGEVNDHE